VEIAAPSRVTRGETIEFVASVTNVGSANAENVVFEWKLPMGFEIVSGDASTVCGTLAPGSSCEAAISVRASYHTVLGIDEIRVVVRYEG